ncbi:MAG: hypothetical protein HQL15_10665 [Candidatus Omnitrophica bacterium]|nr:hypothetical protein [Candidatus Omnitrophota bacterium]
MTKEILVEENVEGQWDRPNIPLSPQEQRMLALYPGATHADWEDWRWQIRNRVRTMADITKFMTLTAQEEKGVIGAGD